MLDLSLLPDLLMLQGHSAPCWDLFLHSLLGDLVQSPRLTQLLCASQAHAHILSLAQTFSLNPRPTCSLGLSPGSLTDLTDPNQPLLLPQPPSSAFSVSGHSILTGTQAQHTEVSFSFKTHADEDCSSLFCTPVQAKTTPLTWVNASELVSLLLNVSPLLTLLNGVRILKT